jgi:hypothetical protein
VRTGLPETRIAPPEEYKKQITPPSAHVTYIRLRLSVALEHQAEVERKLVDSIGAHSGLVWEFEVMRTYRVRNDLGNRFGSNDDSQTLRFVRYWGRRALQPMRRRLYIAQLSHRIRHSLLA